MATAASPLKTARMTVLIDPETKSSFLQLCRTLDLTPSQVVRRFIRDFMADDKRTRPPVAARRRR
ncbi:MAG: CopG family transcriptional regulator [Comamonadaceae bacterium]|nr:MAG: CopG family transcriptional regulator [Comamonadaceae bacterium]